MPPQAARSERSERPDAATAAKNSGLRRQNARFVKRPARRQAGVEWAEWCGATKGGGIVPPNRLAAAGAERTARPQNPCLPLAGGGIRRQPLRKAAGECDKTSILLRRPQPQRIKSQKVVWSGCIWGDYDTPHMRSVFRDFQKCNKAAYRAAKPPQKTRNRVFRKKSLFRDFQKILKMML